MRRSDRRRQTDTPRPTSPLSARAGAGAQLREPAAEPLVFRHLRETLPDELDGLVLPSRPIEDSREIQVGADKAGVELDGPLEGPDSLIDLPRLAGRCSEVIPDIGVAGLERARPLERLEGFRPVALPRFDLSQGHPRLRESGPDAGGLTQRCARPILISRLLHRESEVVEGVVVAGVVLQELLVESRGLLILSLLQIDRGEIHL